LIRTQTGEAKLSYGVHYGCKKNDSAERAGYQLDPDKLWCAGARSCSAPQLNPQEHIWDKLREKEFPNRVFNHLDAVIRQLEQGLPSLAADRDRLRSLTAWPWIVSLNLNAH